LDDDNKTIILLNEPIQEKTNIIATHSASVGLIIHKGKSKILKVNNNNTAPIRLEGEALEEVESFTYQRSRQVGSDTCRCEGADWKGKSSFPSAEESLGIL